MSVEPQKPPAGLEPPRSVPFGGHVAFFESFPRVFKRAAGLTEGLVGATIVVAMLLGGVGFVAEKWLPLPSLVVYSLFLPLFAGLMVFFFREVLWVIKVRRAQSVAAGSVENVIAPRLCCVGAASQVNLGKRVDGSYFEPQVHAVIFAVPFSRAMTIAAIAFAAPLAAITYALSRRVMSDPFFAIQLIVPGFAALGGIVSSLVWPTYFRIAPGRLDVMRFSNFVGKPQILASYDLRTVRILIDLKRCLLFIDDAPRCDAYLLRYMRHRTAFAHTLLTAALSTAPTPPLPDDALIG